MTKVLFIDDRLGEVIRQWLTSGCASNYEILPLEPFDSIERTCQLVELFKPTIILVGYGLGKPGITGADVILSLRQKGYKGHVIANSGGGVEQFNQANVKVDGSANRNPRDLKTAMDNLTKEKTDERTQ